ncbi:hypothetical protein ACFS07_30915 [Undibacterium arcticum]
MRPFFPQGIDIFVQFEVLAIFLALCVRLCKLDDERIGNIAAVIRAGYLDGHEYDGFFSFVSMAALFLSNAIGFTVAQPVTTQQAIAAAIDRIIL